MKILIPMFFAAVAAIGLIAVSCQKEETVYLSRDEANRAAVEYLRLDGDQYALTLSRTKAMELESV